MCASDLDVLPAWHVPVYACLYLEVSVTITCARISISEIYLHVTQTAQLQQGIILQMLFKVLSLLEKPGSCGLYGVSWFEILKDM